ncbi:MAG: amidohydrolase family protein [Novosphingobium sp.]|nr:amidohydrolase family protein [Novosphingobium sp.]MBK9009687.1 amidohydrolase family protein [Novosphingobium sp.]
MGAQYDLVIRGGEIADGTGGETYMGDVAVKDGRIAAIGKVDGSGVEEIDARGRIVTPGFVDVHTHYDGQAIWSRHLAPSSSHGVTTAVMGNCGVGFAPCRKADHELLIKVMEGVEDIPGVVMAEGLDWHWESFTEYLDAVEAGQRDIDVAAYLPHSPLRVFVMGTRGAEREPATAEDLARMRELAREAMEAGAVGFSSSRLNIHRTADGGKIPSFEAPADELKAIAMGMKDAGSGTLQMVLDAPYRAWADEVGILVDIAEACERPATFSMINGNHDVNSWRSAIAQVEAANARGAHVTAQVLPRPIGLLSGLELSINPFVLCPSFAPIADLPLEEKLAAMRDPAMRAQLLSEPMDGGHPLAMLGRSWKWMFPLGETPNYTPERDECILSLAQAAGVTPEEWAYDYLVAGDGRNMILGALANFPECRIDALEEMLKHPDCVIGLGDGGAHYGAICDASYPTFLLTHWVRKLGKISVAEAAEILAAKPARALGFRDRGVLRVGAKADINVIDLTAMHLPAPHIERDLPAGGRRLDQRAKGYDATIVSGTIIRRFDQPTGALPGRLVRSGQLAA